ncbi:MAG: hypothetical protein RL213_2097 [Bacteroidota bacterium]|jgi:ATP-binding cassette subfamily B protein
MRSLAHLNKYFTKYRGLLILGIVFVVLQNFGAIYPAQVVRKSLDEVIRYLKGPEGGTEALEFISEKVFGFFLLIIGVALMRGLLMFLMRQTIIVMSRRIEYDLKNEIYDQYQRLDLSFYRRNNTGDLMNRISEDVSRVRMYIGPAVMYSINLLVLFVLVTISMLRVNPVLTLYVLAPLPFLSVSIYYVSSVMNRKSEEVQEQQSRLSTFVQEAFSGIRILKAFSKEEEFTARFAGESQDYLDRNMGLVRVNAMFYPLMLLLVGVSTVLTVYVGGKEVIAGRATTGNIAEFIIYVNMLTWPVASLGWVTAIIQRAAASQQRINEFLHLETGITGGGDKKIELKGGIEFRNVTFIYPDTGIKALDDVSFRVSPGGSVALLGRTGSGKSTVAQLLLRMYDVTSGEILVDGVPIKSIPLDRLRGSIGYVPQDVFLFSDSIANNIAFGSGKESERLMKDGSIENAAEAAAVADNIRNFPGGFRTLIGERGITLSGGQKQRISIARALIREPRILVLDDCLSAVDTGTEERILDNLKRSGSGRTTLMISHRVSTLRNAETVLVLEQGKITERGSHAELLAAKGTYADMSERQSAEKTEN